MACRWTFGCWAKNPRSRSAFIISAIYRLGSILTRDKRVHMPAGHIVAFFREKREAMRPNTLLQPPSLPLLIKMGTKKIGLRQRSWLLIRAPAHVTTLDRKSKRQNSSH